MTLEQVYQDIKDSFNGLWETKIRGNSLEVITPYASTNNRFVSVFITRQSKEYIITDGGWINGGIYNEAGINDEPCFLKVLYHFQSSFGIQEIKSQDGTVFFYLKTTNTIDIASKVFDLSTFIQNIISVLDISFESKAETETKKRFISQANEYLKSFIIPNKIKINTYLNPDKKEIKFNALYYKSPSKITLVNYITGSSQFHFSNSIFKANTLFEMAEETALKAHVEDKVSIIDTNAMGYIPNKIGHYLFHLQKQTNSILINWSEKEKLQTILN